MRNRSILLEANDSKPCVSNIHRAIIVQLRLKDTQGNFFHLGLANLATRIDALKEVLGKALNEIEGKIELLIASGNSSSNKLYQSVRQYVESAQKVHPSRVHLRDDYFSAADLRLWLPKEECPNRKS